MTKQDEIQKVRRASIENLDQIIKSKKVAEKNSYQENVIEMTLNKQLQKQDDEWSRFESSVLGGGVENEAKSDDKVNATTVDKAVPGTSRLKAKRLKRQQNAASSKTPEDQPRMRKKSTARRRSVTSNESMTRRRSVTSNESTSPKKMTKKLSMRMKAKNESEKKALARKAREEFDEGLDDTEEEKQKRRAARKILIKYKGTVWDVAKSGDYEMLERFFFVENSEKLLAMHDPNPSQGRRTLLHTTSWYGHIKMVKFLVQLGADVNAIDTVYSKTTPLMEATRAGRREICEILVKNGANICYQDANGDTALHWACRKGFGSILTAIIDHAEDNSPGSLSGIFGIENYRDQECLMLTESSITKRLARKKYGVSVISAAEKKYQKKEERRFRNLQQNERERKQEEAQQLKEAFAEKTAHLVIERSLNSPDIEFTQLTQIEEPHLKNLDSLGLDLSDFAYSKR